MTQSRYSILPWDSKFWGIKVGAIIPPVIQKDLLKDILCEMARNGVRLVYWASTNRIDAQIIYDFGGELVDRKTTLTTLIEQATFPRGIPTRHYTALLNRYG